MTQISRYTWLTVILPLDSPTTYCVVIQVHGHRNHVQCRTIYLTSVPWSIFFLSIILIGLSSFTRQSYQYFHTLFNSTRKNMITYFSFAMYLNTILFHRCINFFLLMYIHLIQIFLNLYKNFIFYVSYKRKSVFDGVSSSRKELEDSPATKFKVMTTFNGEL